jgi:hypothetical protein
MIDIDGVDSISKVWKLRIVMMKKNRLKESETDLENRFISRSVQKISVKKI